MSELATALRLIRSCMYKQIIFTFKTYLFNANILRINIKTCVDVCLVILLYIQNFRSIQFDKPCTIENVRL